MANPQARQFLEQAVQSIQSGQFAQALQLVDQSIALEPDNSEAHVVRAISLSQTSQPDAAIDAFNRAIDFDPSNIKAFFNLAVHFSSLGRKADALAAAQDALKIDSSHSAAHDLVNRLRAEGISAASATWQPPKRPATATVIDAAGHVESAAGTAPVGMPSSMPPPSAGAVPPQGMAPPREGGMMPPPQGAPPQGPYGPGPQQAQPYYRPGYETQSEHSLAWVGNMGSGWTGMGWAVTGIAFALSIVYLLMIWPMISQIAVDFEAAMQTMQRDPQAFQSGSSQVVGWILAIFNLAALLWLIFDCVDRRRGWIWLLPFFLCCCCSGHLLGWSIPALYLAAGRK